MSTGLLGFETIEERQSGVDSYISPSRLNCWLACPRKFAYRYIEGIRSPPSPSMFLGKVVHFGMEATYRHLQLGVRLEADQVVQKLLDGWAMLIDEDSVTFDSLADEQAMQNQACELVRAYLAIVPPNEKPLAVEVALEAPLVDPESGKDLGMPLVGVVDLVLEGQGGPTICDFKTAARSSEPMEISHEIQLSSYAWLYRQITGRQEAGLEIRSLIKTKVPKCEFHPYAARSDAHFRRLFSVIREYLDALDRGTFNYRPGFGCTMCDYRRECQAWTGTS
ncbi:MAG: PD-(D/E)XK nuclease family protein [Planctomycetota bacterium]